MVRLLPVALLLVAACGGVASPETTVPVATTPATTTTAAPTTTVAPTTTNRVTTTTTDRCAEASAQGIASFGILFDRLDMNPSLVLDNPNFFSEIAGELGGLVGAECGLERGGEAISELLVFLADEAPTRSHLTATYINGLIDTLCDSPPVELNLSGRSACALSG